MHHFEKKIKNSFQRGLAKMFGAPLECFPAGPAVAVDKPGFIDFCDLRLQRTLQE